MINDIEAGGDLVNAGLVATEIEGGVGTRDKDASHRKKCLNCDTPLIGAYCHACGQSGHVHRSLLHLIEELLHGLFHFDAKGWRTIPLLVAFPGRLTRNYIDGQRTRYVSPLALFLFMVFLMFFVASFSAAPTVGGSAADRKEARADLAAAVQNAKEDVSKAEVALAEARKTGDDIDEAESQLKAARNGEKITELALAGADKVMTTDKDITSTELAKNLWTGPVDTGFPAVDKAIRHALDNPELMLYKLKNSAYKLSFLLIPISLPFLWLMFIGRREIGMYDHAVFSLYSLSFMSLLFVVVLFCAFAGWDGMIPLLFCVPPLHMYLQLRDTYRLGVVPALWRTIALIIVAGTVFLLFLALILVVTVH